MTDDRFRSDEGGRAVREEYDRLLSAHLPDVERIVVDGTHVLSAGPDGAPTVVLLHGSGGTSLNWATEIPLLAQSHRVHALDLPGEPGGMGHEGWGIVDALGRDVTGVATGDRVAYSSQSSNRNSRWNHIE